MRKLRLLWPEIRFYLAVLLPISGIGIIYLTLEKTKEGVDNGTSTFEHRVFWLSVTFVVFLAIMLVTLTLNGSLDRPTRWLKRRLWPPGP